MRKLREQGKSLGTIPERQGDTIRVVGTTKAEPYPPLTKRALADIQQKPEQAVALPPRRRLISLEDE